MLDRDELAARCLVAMLSNPHLVGLGKGVDDAVLWADALLAALVPVAPASGAPAPLPGAPLAAPSRPEWVPKVGERVRVTRDNANHASVKAGDEYVVTSLGSDPYPETEAWGCGTGGTQYVRVCNLEPCAAPSPAATPAAKPWTWKAKPEVGDVWVHPLFPDTHVIITDADGGLTLSAGKNFNKGDRSGVGAASSDGAFGWYYLRRATSSERAAAGLPVEAPAFDEAKEREAALGVWRTTVGGLPDNFVEGWLARARVAAKGGA